MINNSDVSQKAVTQPSSIFAEALREDSNRESDWLWYAGQMTSAVEKQYCLERALYINPANDATQRALLRLRRHHQADTRPIWPARLLRTVTQRFAR